MNGLSKKVIFDTGASENMLCSVMLKDFPGFIIKPMKKDVCYFNVCSCKTMCLIKFFIKYKSKKLI